MRVYLERVLNCCTLITSQTIVSVLNMPQKVKKMNKKLPRIKPVELENGQEENEEIEIESVSPAVKSGEEKFSLYVRGAAWIKDRDNALARFKEIEPRIREVRHPRQKSDDFCFVDFASASDRDESYHQLKNHSEIKVRIASKDVPKLLNKRQKQIAEKREAKAETRKLIQQIKKKEKLNAKLTEKPNQIVIINLPREVTVGELKQQYPTSVKMIVKKHPSMKNNRTAIINFPNPFSALEASRKELTLHGQKIKVVLNKEDAFKGKSKKKKNKRKSDASEQETEQPPQKIVKAN